MIPLNEFEHVRRYVIGRIMEFYSQDSRPIMLAGSPFGVHICLRTLHDVWANIYGRERELMDAYYRQRENTGCNIMAFCDTCQMRHPEAGLEDVAGYEVKQWTAASRDVWLG
jgi:hypothetical protein